MCRCLWQLLPSSQQELDLYGPYRPAPWSPWAACRSGISKFPPGSLLQAVRGGGGGGGVSAVWVRTVSRVGAEPKGSFRICSPLSLFPGDPALRCPYSQVGLGRMCSRDQRVSAAWAAAPSCAGVSAVWVRAVSRVGAGSKGSFRTCSPMPLFPGGPGLNARPG